MIFTIALFPKGRKAEKVPAIYFPDKETKEAYIVQEGKFCLDEYNKYLSSNTAVREDYQKDLDDKRIVFAKSMGYQPRKMDKFYWEYVEPKELEPEPKRFA